MLRKYRVPSDMHPDYIILSVGINDRANNVNSTTIPAMPKLVARASKMFPGTIIVVPEMNCSGKLPECEIRNVNSLNAELRRTPQVVCAPRCRAMTSTVATITYTGRRPQVTPFWLVG